MTYAVFELRPEPGSRVNLIPAHTQGAGDPVSGLPVKGQNQPSAQDSISAVSFQAQLSQQVTEGCD